MSEKQSSNADQGKDNKRKHQVEQPQSSQQTFAATEVDQMNQAPDAFNQGASGSDIMNRQPSSLLNRGPSQLLQRQASAQTGSEPELPAGYPQLRLHGRNFAQLPAPAASRPLIQPKLRVGPVGDPYEQEADRVAEQVVNMPALVQRSEEEESTDQELQMKPLIQRLAEGGFETDNDFERRLNNRRGTGAPLLDTLRADFEPKFGADFSGVRIHTDAQSDQLNQSIQAKAFTTGQDMFFRQGAYQPQSHAGQELIAHELTHVVQQTGSVVQRADSGCNCPACRGGRIQAKVDGIQRHEIRERQQQSSEGRVSPAEMQSLMARLPSVQRSAESGAALGQAVEITQQSHPNRIHRCGGGKKAKARETAKTVEVAKPKPDVPQHPPQPKSTMDNAGGQEILKKAYGDVKEIVPGKIQILSQEDFKKAYDAIYGTTQYAWDTYVAPTFGNLNGFAHDGTNYINRATAGLHTVVHEMLHNNTADDWRGVVGSEWDEGTTEVLTIEACTKVNEPAPICYPGQTPVIRYALSQGLSMSDLTSAYLKSGAQQKIADWADTNCKENWAAIKGYMQAKNFAAAKAALQKK